MATEPTASPSHSPLGYKGLVIAQLRSALEEERHALLGQIEALRLAIDDEHEYRGRAAQSAPSLTNLLELKRTLQQALLQTEAVCRISSPTPRNKAVDLEALNPLPGEDLEAFHVRLTHLHLKSLQDLRGEQSKELAPRTPAPPPSDQCLCHSLWEPD